MGNSYHHENLRAALIERGRTLLLRDGYAQFSMRRLAAELGVSHAAPYRHFPSREELIGAIIREDGARFDRALAAGVEDVSDPYERLYRLGEAYVFFFLDNPEVLHLFNALPGQIALQGEALATLFAAGFHGAEAHPEDCVSRTGNGNGCSDYPDDEGYTLLREATQPFAGRFAGLSDREIILGYWAKVHGLASLLVGHTGVLPEEGLRDRVKVLVRTPF
jgi:AcrR family transcriptional regulator